METKQVVVELPMEYEEVSFQELSSLSPLTVSKLKKAFSEKGWIIVDYPEDIKLQLKMFYDGFSNFLQKPLEEKQKYVQLTNFGYVSNDYKEAYRWLTADLLQLFAPPLEFSENLTNFTIILDNFFLKFIQKAGENLFHYFNENIPLITPYLQKHNILQTKGFYSGYKFGMLDLVEYHSENLTREYIVDEHCDPGLISLSMLSNESGLELFDVAKNEWFKVPLNKGALWCGLEGSHSGYNHQGFKAGKHRVAKNKSGKRLAMWYEVCSKNQVSKDYILMKKDVKLGLDVYNIKVKSFPIKVRDGEKDTIIMVDGEMRIDTVKSYLEQKLGLPISKVKFVKSEKSEIITMKNHKKVKEFNLQRDSVILLNPIEKEKPAKKKIDPCQCYLI